MHIINKSNGILIGDKIKFADNFWTRLKGLLGRKGLDDGEGMLLYPCSAIHCWGMKFNIDAIFLDENKKVLEIRKSMIPGSKASIKGARYVLELGEGTIDKKMINIGDLLLF